MVSGMARLLLTFNKNKGDKKRTKAQSVSTYGTTTYFYPIRDVCSAHQRFAPSANVSKIRGIRILVRARYRHDWGSFETI